MPYLHIWHCMSDVMNDFFIAKIHVKTKAVCMSAGLHSIYTV